MACLLPLPRQPCLFCPTLGLNVSLKEILSSQSPCLCWTLWDPESPPLASSRPEGFTRCPPQRWGRQYSTKTCCFPLARSLALSGP